jgi:hypothetical protein
VWSQLAELLSGLRAALPDKYESQRASLEDLCRRLSAKDFSAVYAFFEAVYREPGGLQSLPASVTGGAAEGRLSECLSLARMIASPPPAQRWETSASVPGPGLGRLI